MIKVDKANTEITGTYPVLMAEFSVMVRGLHDKLLIEGMGMSPEKAKEKIHSAIELAFMDASEKHAKAEEKLRDNPMLILKVLQEIMTRKGDE